MESQQYHYRYQTTQNDANSAPLSLSYASYDPSQLQSYDQSTQPYYAYNQPQQQLDYSSYYCPNYSNSYHTQNDPNSIYPPGAEISAETQQSHLHDTQNLHYRHGVSATQPPPSQGYTLPGHSTYNGQGSQNSRHLRGGGHGTFGRHGRGRGSGRGKPPAGSSAPTPATPSKPPPQKAWCELCKVDCNTVEILEQHKNGKKHKKNLKVHEELQNLTRQQMTKNPQTPISKSNPQNITSSKDEGSTSRPGSVEAKAEGALGKDETLKADPSSGAPPSEKSVRKDRLMGRGGLKRSTRGGRGGKWMRAHDGSRRAVEPPKPKVGFPLICELCNVKCESQVVYESHIAGKKHIANAKRPHGHREVSGEGLQALYPANPSAASTSIVPPQVHQQGPHDAQALASMMLSQQNLQDPQAAQAALTLLLNQHGIHDAQTLLVQLIPYLLAQCQVPGLVPAPLAGFGMVNTQNPQSQGVASPAGAGSQKGITESIPRRTNATANTETKEGTQKNDKLDNNNNVRSEQLPCTAKEPAVSKQERQSC